MVRVYDLQVPRVESDRAGRVKAAMEYLVHAHPLSSSQTLPPYGLQVPRVEGECAWQAKARWSTWCVGTHV